MTRAPLRAALLLLATGACKLHPAVSAIDRPPPVASDAAAADAVAADRPTFFEVPDVAPRKDASLPGVSTALDCGGAAKQHGNAGCSFYPLAAPAGGSDPCLAIFVVNQGDDAAHLKLERGGQTFALTAVARIPRGAGRALTYEPFDEATGIAPGGVALVFLAGAPGSALSCPAGITPATTDVAAVRSDSGWSITGTGKAFHLTSDRPVVAYQTLPYGGAGSQVTSATLLLPQESWGQTYFATTPADADLGHTFVIVVAGDQGADLVFRPSVRVAAGGPVAALDAGTSAHVSLNAGEFVQFVALDPREGLSGSVVNANKPIALFGGVDCFDVPTDSQSCDSGHQQVPPLSAMGHEYAAVRYRSRVPGKEEVVPWQFVGAVAGTTLSYAPSAPAGAPTSLGPGQVVTVSTADPFVVRSQDGAHPFHLSGFMTGWSTTGRSDMPGDPEFVRVVPVEQYMNSYVFFTDPTYPETNLVVTRAKDSTGALADVFLGCSPMALGPWQSLGDVEFTRVDLVTGNFEPAIAGCDNGRQTMTSASPFGVTVWGWGSGLVKINDRETSATSYAYPAGGALRSLNAVPPPLIE